MLTESAMLGVLGVLLGMVIAAWTTAVLVRAMPDLGGLYTDMVRFKPSRAIIGFTALAGALSVALFGLIPALRATRTGVAEMLKAGQRTASRRQGGLMGRGVVAIQVALALTLVSTASLLVATLHNLTSQNIGVTTEHITGMGVETRGTRLERDGIVPIHGEILRHAREAPGVSAAGMATLAPLFGGRAATLGIEMPDGRVREDEAYKIGITPGFLDVYGIGLAAGRRFTDADAAGSERVAIISRALARMRFGDADPLGQTLRLRDDSAASVRIVGVAADVSLRGPRDGATEIVYEPLTQVGHWPYVELLVRTRADDAAITSGVMDAVHAAAPGIRVRNVDTARDKLEAWLLREILLASLASFFGVLALGLAAIGIYGVIAYNVTRRTGEIGIRMALGAQGRDVLALVLRSSLSLTGIGVLAGVPLVLVAGRALNSMLYGVGAHDPVMLLLSVLILALVTLLSSGLPALRATRIDPLVALRSE